MPFLTQPSSSPRLGEQHRDAAFCIVKKCLISQRSDPGCPDHLLCGSAKIKKEKSSLTFNERNISATRSPDEPLAVIRCPLQTVDSQTHATILHNRRCNGWNQLHLAPVTCACAMPLTTAAILSCDTLNFERKKGSRTEYRAGPHGQVTLLPQVKYVPCLQQVQISHPLVSETIALTFDPFLLDRSDSSKFKGLQYMPGALVEITTILLFVSLRARTNAHTDSHTPTHSTSHADISLLVCLSSATVTTRSSAGQHSELPGHHQKERNASKSDKAQCSFCGFSETRPSLSPTHICTITNRCPKIPSQPAYRKLALRPSVYYSIFSVTTSGSVTLHFLNSISSAHVPKHSGQKPMQMLGRWMGAGEGQKH